MPFAPAPAAPLHPSSERALAVDALRGVAMVWMTVFHFCFDLSHFGFWPQEFRTDPFWTLQRTAIVSLFLFCAGLGQAMAWSQGLGWGRFFRRWGQIAACALLVTAGSYWMFPRSFIHFGVLHGMAVMLIVARCTAGAGPWLWPAGALALAAPWVGAWALAGPLADWAPLFDSRALNWLGWVTRKPFTEDYVPVLPWLGVLWWGLAAGQWMARHRPGWLAGRAWPRAARPLAVLGRWSLSYYMLHQPVMIGALMAVVWWRGGA
ncbi:putative membrane protein [Paracidovorax anthurii]|uniref:Putative membrane protein n=2 Tax=Paracidovorax anthurii TaxID=78229 RepID=A0A328YQR9_9BURK|nr:heparan-alpha-glucosaminide N-acetyltransferase [Paracidovorax anthurii]RAR76371.1 putative membrane protein [Paracidovorax anthurii]